MKNKYKTLEEHTEAYLKMVRMKSMLESEHYRRTGQYKTLEYIMNESQAKQEE